VTGSGHRSVPHTADMRIEAWAPSREECVGEAVRGMVEAFAEVPPAGARSDAEFEVGPAPDGDLLAGVLDEIIYLMDTTGRVPAAADVTAVDDVLRVRLALVESSTVVGAVPKAVALHDLRFERTGTGYACAATLDV
jgi:SHS2 domain-containing protein